MGTFFKLLAALVAIAIPLLGAWAGSSLAAFANGPIWAALLAALCAFPIVPLVWDLISEARRPDGKKRILTFFDRLILRTLLVNVVFLGTLLFFGRDILFTALAGRGDWMLDGRSGEAVDAARNGLLTTADRLEWVFSLLEEDNEYREMVEQDDGAQDDVDFSGSIDHRDPAVEPPSRAPATEDDDAGAPAAAGDDDSEWPFRDEIHPVVKNMPASAEQSIESLAQYVVAQERDPLQRVKALHDWVADHIAYDAALLLRMEAGEFVSAETQSAERVFRDRKGVCAGYANLMAALGRVVGIEIRVVVGHARSSMDGVGHAWNAVNIEGRWYLIDATWNAGSVEPGTPDFTKRYSTAYFLAPARVFGLNHFPEDPNWQLQQPPVSRGEFTRQPNLTPRFFMHGFRLASPRRSQVTVADSVTISVDNPNRHSLLASFAPKGGGTKTRCDVTGTTEITATCQFPRSGVYVVTLFGNEAREGTHWSVGTVEVVRQ